MFRECSGEVVVEDLSGGIRDGEVFSRIEELLEKSNGLTFLADRGGFVP